MNQNMAVTITAAALMMTAAAAAQPADVLVPAPPGAVPREGVVINRTFGIAEGGRPESGATFEFISSEMGIEGQTVKAAPYSAEAVTESIQVLSDGNRITRKNSTALFRDGEGRTRREVSLTSIGPWVSAGATRIVMIHDPVAGVSYTLDEKSKTARKVAGKGMALSYAKTIGAPPAGIRMAAPAGVGQSIATLDMSMPALPARPERQNTKTESLGKQNIEGLVAEGTRTIVTIPAGEIGNERPIEVVSERWFSPELHAVIMTRHSNPMSGESTYKLTNIHRGEPSGTLFEVPSEYTIRAEEPPVFRVRKPQEE